MTRGDLVALVRADVAAQRVAHAAGELDGVYEGETWGEYVATCAYWESREGLTGEHVMCRVVGYAGCVPYRRISARLVAEWFVCAHNSDGSTTTMLCPLHADTDPCLTMAQVTGRRRRGSIVRGVCTACGWRDLLREQDAVRRERWSEVAS